MDPNNTQGSMTSSSSSNLYPGLDGARLHHPMRRAPAPPNPMSSYSVDHLNNDNIYDASQSCKFQYLYCFILC